MGEENLLRESSSYLIFKFARELARIFGGNWLKKKIIICGSYIGGCKDRLTILKRELKKIEGVYPYLMDELPNFTSNLLHKFKVLDAASDGIIFVIEHDEKGYIIGVGWIPELILTAVEEQLTRKSIVFIEENTKIPAMLKGIFNPPYFTPKRNLHVFRDKDIENVAAIAKKWIRNTIQHNP